MNITFIGGGNMAAALISGLLQQGFASSQICVVEINAESRENIKNRFNVLVEEDLAKGAAHGDIIVLSIKPQQLVELAKQLGPLLAQHLVVSIAAGICATDIIRWLGGHERVIRVMPNTPSLVGAGVSGLYAAQGTHEQDRNNAEIILSAVGTVLWVEQEEMLHAVTAISGSGPAYVFYFIESMQQAGIELGLTAEQARQLSLDTFLGASKLADQSEEEAATLRARVTSKGGTTEQAIQTMEKNDVKDQIKQAIFAANKRSRELSEEFSQY